MSNEALQIALGIAVLVSIGALALGIIITYPQDPDGNAISELWRERVVRNHVCPFCHYIGPPLLCGCVTELYDTLKMADEDLVTEEYTRNAISKHADRVRLLNDALQRERARRVPAR